MSTMREKLLHKVAPAVAASDSKVTIVGTGQVGMACAFNLLSQGISSELVLVDMVPDKLQGEVMDLQHGSTLLSKSAVIKASGPDLKETANSRIIVISAGARHKVGETRLDLVQRNTEIFRDLIPRLVQASPKALLLVVSNPVDVLTYVAWKISGLPANQVIGSGTNIDSSRFRYLLSKRLNVCPSSLHGWIIGEHGDTSVPVWSGVNVAGVRLRDINPTIGTTEDVEKWGDVHQQVVQSAYDIIKLKGYTSWAIGISVGVLCQVLLRNSHSVHAVSTLAKGQYGIDEEVFLSLPCVLGSQGVEQTVTMTLTESEQQLLHRSASTMSAVQAGLKI